MIKTPECDKLLEVKDKSQIIGVFLEWLQSQDIQLYSKPVKEAVIARMKGENDKKCPECGGILIPYRMAGGTHCASCGIDISSDYYEKYLPFRKPIEQILAWYFDINLNKCEEERRQMLEEIRR